MVSPTGVVMTGYSKSCESLFVPKLEIEGARFTDALGLSVRESGHFTSCYEQIIDDFLPEEVSVGQLPSRILVGNTTLSVTGAVIRDEEDNIESVLFSVADISDLIEAEHEAQRMTGVLRVLQFRDRFEEFLQGFNASLVELEAGTELSPDAYQRECRMVFHTAKGVFAQYGVAGLAETIHKMEDAEILSRDHVSMLRESVATLVRENENVWGISLNNTNPSYDVSEAELADFEAEVRGQGTDVVAIAIAFARRCREKNAAHLIGPVVEACRHHAEKNGKQVELVLQGEDVRIPASASRAFDVITHLLRNAIDHGIEEAVVREHKGKSVVGTIGLSVSRHDDDIEIRISDDGAGIDEKQVARSAVEEGVLTQDEADKLSVEGKRQLIFRSGLSTAGTVTETSGRGIGMSAVQSVVEGIGGAITIESSAESGTTMILLIPGRREVLRKSDAV